MFTQTGRKFAQDVCLYQADRDLTQNFYAGIPNFVFWVLINNTYLLCKRHMFCYKLYMSNKSPSRDVGCISAFYLCTGVLGSWKQGGGRRWIYVRCVGVRGYVRACARVRGCDACISRLTYRDPFSIIFLLVCLSGRMSFRRTYMCWRHTSVAFLNIFFKTGVDVCIT